VQAIHGKAGPDQFHAGKPGCRPGHLSLSSRRSFSGHRPESSPCCVLLAPKRFSSRKSSSTIQGPAENHLQRAFVTLCVARSRNPEILADSFRKLVPASGIHFPFKSPTRRSAPVRCAAARGIMEKRMTVHACSSLAVAPLAPHLRIPLRTSDGQVQSPKATRQHAIGTTRH